MADSSSQQTVNVSTFLKWNTGGVINFRSADDGKVKSVWCSLCAKYADRILKQFNIKGQCKRDICRYIEGTDFVTKHSVMRHLSGSVHKAATQFEDLLEGTASTSAESGDQPIPKQPRIDCVLESAAIHAYEKLFKTAYIMAVNGLPLSHFSTLVNIQKANGVKLINKSDNSNRGNEFVKEIADAVRQKISDLTSSAKSFTLLTDGSQARKTGSEKELVMLRLVRDGRPTFFCVALQDIDLYGNADSENLKKCIDDLVSGEDPKLRISPDDYKQKLVGMTSDGASVNTGVYSGLLTRMTNDDREWLIPIHCVLHRTELVLKDSILKTEFVGVHEFLITLHYLFKNSGKLKRHFQEMANVHGAQVYNFPKVQGTRFVSHQRRGLEHLLNNWIVLAHTIEDCIENNRVTAVTAKLRGVLKKLKDYNFLSTCVFFLRVLDAVSVFSQQLQRDDLLVSDVLPAMERAKARCEESSADQPSTTADLCTSSGFQLTQTNGPDDGDTQFELSQRVLKKGHKRRRKRKKESIKLTMTGLTYVSKARETISKLKNSTVQDLNRCMDARFRSLSSSLFVDIGRVVDPANWCDLQSEIESLQNISEHFQSTLAYNSFEADKLVSEWKDLKIMVKHHYQGVEAKVLWQKIFEYRRDQLPNVCMLLELVLCLGPSNGVVESGFSHLTSMLNDRRLSLKHATMENLLIITVNDLVWSDKDREDILSTAQRNFMAKKRRKVKLDESDVCLLGAVSRKRNRERQRVRWGPNL